MKLYNYFISFTNANTGEFARLDNERGSYWRRTKEGAMCDMNRDLDWCSQGSKRRAVKVSSYGIVEKEMDSKIEIVGEIDTREDGEDYAVMIGEVEVNRIAQYKGCKVKVTVEFLE